MLYALCAIALRHVLSTEIEMQATAVEQLLLSQQDTFYKHVNITVQNGVDVAGLDFRSEVFGGGRRFGFGRIYVAGYDGTSARFASDDAVRRLVNAVVTRERVTESGPPLLGHGTVPMQDFDYMGVGRPFDELRAGLAV